MDILDLPGWTVTGKQLDGYEYEIAADYTLQPEACIKCGVVGRLYRHGTKTTTYRDSPIRGHAVRILATVRRYKCRECGETFLQPLGGIQDARRMTERCVRFIQQQCLRDTFVRIAENIGCDDKTVRALAGEYIATLEAKHDPLLPNWLGIDETKIDGRMHYAVADGAPIDPYSEALWPHCMSCGGVFPRTDLVVDPMPAIVRGERPRDAALCRDCLARFDHFHTGAVSHHDSGSTR